MISALKSRFEAVDTTQSYNSYIDATTYRSYNSLVIATTLVPATIPISEAAERLGVHENTVRNWIDLRLLDGYRTPTGRRKLRLGSVERLEREMFGVPSPAAELGEPQIAPANADELQRAQSTLP